MRKFLQEFVFAGRGFPAALAGQVNLKVMLTAAATAGVLGLILGINRLEWMALTLSLGLVLSLELMNTALEKLIDALHPARDPRIGAVKDILAAAVLVASVTAAMTGALIFLG